MDFHLIKMIITTNRPGRFHVGAYYECGASHLEIAYSRSPYTGISLFFHKNGHSEISLFDSRGYEEQIKFLPDKYLHYYPVLIHFLTQLEYMDFLCAQHHISDIETNGFLLTHPQEILRKTAEDFNKRMNEDFNERKSEESID